MVLEPVGFSVAVLGRSTAGAPRSMVELLPGSRRFRALPQGWVTLGVLRSLSQIQCFHLENDSTNSVQHVGLWGA